MGWGITEVSIMILVFPEPSLFQAVVPAVLLAAGVFVAAAVARVCVRWLRVGSDDPTVESHDADAAVGAAPRSLGRGRALAAL